MLKFRACPATLLCSLSLFLSRGASASTTVDDFTILIRANNLQALRTLAAAAEAVNVSDKLRSTPLHYAALFGSAEATRILLAAGANPNAKTESGTTPLIYAATDFDKTKLLVEKGADVNTPGAMGITALMIAASVHGNAATVRYLLDHGADVKALDALKSNSLARASDKSELEVVRLLLEKGADPKPSDLFGFTALQNAAAIGDPERVSLFLAAGADPNVANSFAGKVKNGPIALTQLTALMLASTHGGPVVVQMLIKGGANVNQLDGRKMSALVLAVATDLADPETVRTLIAAGADVNAKDQNGESVLDWARKFRHPAILAALEKAGAKASNPVAAPQPPNEHPQNAVDAIARTMPLLVKSAPQFFREGGGCGGCHHQPIYARAFVAVSAAHGPADITLRQSIRDAVLAERPRTLQFSTLLANTGGEIDPALAQLDALADLHEPPSLVTDTMLRYIATQQTPSGAWPSFGISRPPIEESPISRTAIAVRLLRTFGWPARSEEFDQRISRAQAWLQTAKPVTNYERADQIMGLKAAGVSSSSLRRNVDNLLKQQNENGGWSQNPYLESDAYATGMVLHTLYASGFLKPQDLAYRKGVAFLLKTQFPDGSWYVKSRAPKFQPYFQSGFPFDHDQWISSTATAWATMALAPAMPPQPLTAVATSLPSSAPDTTRTHSAPATRLPR